MYAMHVYGILALTLGARFLEMSSKSVVSALSCSEVPVKPTLAHNFFITVSPLALLFVGSVLQYLDTVSAVFRSQSTTVAVR